MSYLAIQSIFKWIILGLMSIFFISTIGSILAKVQKSPKKEKLFERVGKFALLLSVVVFVIHALIAFNVKPVEINDREFFDSIRSPDQTR